MVQKVNLVVSLAALIGVVSLFIYISGGQYDEKKIAYIESKRLLANYPPLIKLSKELETKNSNYQGELEKLSNEMQSELKTYEKNRSSMSESQLKTESERLRKKQVEIQQKSKEVQERAKSANMEMVQALTDEVNDRIKIYGDNHDYDLILSATGNGNLAYADRAIDITDDILAELKEHAQNK